MSLKTLTLIPVGLTLLACQPAATAPAPDFDAALINHFNMITSRDLDGYTATITTTDELPLVFPNGVILNTRKEVIDFHRDWFRDEDWVMEPEVLWTRVNGNMAVASTKYSYRDIADGPPRETYLGLVFEVQDGAWRLIHDQNTRITQPEN